MLKRRFPKVPILAMTATATAKVRGDILCTLGISKNCVTFSQSFNRPNLRWVLLDLLDREGTNYEEKERTLRPT